MNRDQLEGKWEQLMGDAKSAWGKLTDEDLKWIEGKRDKLIGKLVERYGVLKEHAQKDVDAWIEKAGERLDQVGGRDKRS